MISEESDEASCHPDVEDNFDNADLPHKYNDSGNKTGRRGCPDACNCSHSDEGSDLSLLTPSVQETMAPKRLAGMCVLMTTLNYLIIWYSDFIVRPPFTTTFAYLLHRWGGTTEKQNKVSIAIKKTAALVNDSKESEIDNIEFPK